MSNFVIVMGETGNGKSSSVKTLNPKETVVLNVLGKRLPFKGSKSSYSKENKNIFKVASWDKVIQLLQLINKSNPEIKNVILDK